MIQFQKLLAAEGGSEIYLLTDGRVVKLLCQCVPAEAANGEVIGTLAARSVGVATPVVREVIEHQGRYGIVFERLEGATMLETLVANPERAEPLGRQLADLHADLHARACVLWRPLHEMLRSRITDANVLPDFLKTAALTALEALPHGTALFHGNFHPGNVILTPGGPIIADWSVLFAGCPAASVAWTSLILQFSGPGDDAQPQLVEILNGVRPTFHDAYRRRYAELRPADAERVAQWMLPMAAVFLAGPATEKERPALLALAKRLIANA